MEPTGPGRESLRGEPTRVRGFRAPTPAERSESSEPAHQPEQQPEQQVGQLQPEQLAVGPPARRFRLGNPTARYLFAAGAVLVAAMVVIATLAFRLGSTSATPPAGQTSPTPTPTPASTATPLPTTELYRQLVASVVLITTSKGSLGSGTVVTDTGTILTANHVISGGGTISVVFADGTRSAATVASRSPKTDTATLVPTKLPEVVVAATLGGSIGVGADVVAIGNPLGLRDSTTTGVVSGTGRTNKTSAGTIGGLIQFDAAVNPGSSGGPLLDDRGNVVGVVLSIANPGGDDAFAGIGFAVPIGSAVSGGAGAGQGGGPQL